MIAWSTLVSCTTGTSRTLNITSVTWKSDKVFILITLCCACTRWYM